jgi:hypothetical protein
MVEHLRRVAARSREQAVLVVALSGGGGLNPSQHHGGMMWVTRRNRRIARMSSGNELTDDDRDRIMMGISRERTFRMIAADLEGYSGHFVGV